MSLDVNFDLEVSFPSFTAVNVYSGLAGPDGLTAFEVAVIKGFVGDEQAWLDSLHGVDGEDGTDGTDGLDSLVPGPDGLTAFEVAVIEGFVGDEQAWLDSLHGAAGADSLVPGPKGDGFNWEGAWSPIKTYAVDDVVESNGSNYIRLIAGGPTPPYTTPPEHDTFSGNWELFVSKGADGINGWGLPVGGTTGQVLKKASDLMYNYEWDDIPKGDIGPAGPGVPLGGLTGQALVKASDDDDDTEWAEASGGGGLPEGGTTGQVLAKNTSADGDAEWRNGGVGMVLKGPYTTGVTYYPGDTVYYKGYNFTAINETITPPLSEDYVNSIILWANGTRSVNGIKPELFPILNNDGSGYTTIKTKAVTVDTTFTKLELKAKINVSESRRSIMGFIESDINFLDSRWSNDMVPVLFTGVQFYYGGGGGYVIGWYRGEKIFTSSYRAYLDQGTGTEFNFTITPSGSNPIYTIKGDPGTRPAVTFTASPALYTPLPGILYGIASAGNIENYLRVDALGTPSIKPGFGSVNPDWAPVYKLPELF